MTNYIPPDDPLGASRLNASTSLLNSSDSISPGDYIEWQRGSWTKISPDSMLIGQTVVSAIDYLKQRDKNFSGRFRRPNAQ